MIDAYGQQDDEATGLPFSLYQLDLHFCIHAVVKAELQVQALERNNNDNKVLFSSLNVSGAIDSCRAV